MRWFNTLILASGIAGCAGDRENEPTLSSSVVETSDGDWERHLDVNVMSGVRLSRAYLPGMLERGGPRRVPAGEHQWW